MHGSNLQPLVTANGRKWPQVAASDCPKRVAATARKWPLQTFPSEWPQVAASGHKWPQVAAPDSSKRVAASGRSRLFQASGCKWPHSAKSISTLKATSLWTHDSFVTSYVRLSYQERQLQSWIYRRMLWMDFTDIATILCYLNDRISLQLTAPFSKPGLLELQFERSQGRKVQDAPVEPRYSPAQLDRF